MVSIINFLPLPVHCVKGAGATHIFCNNQAIEILANDGHTRAAKLFAFFSSVLDYGVTWADKGFRSFYHFFDAETGNGKWYWPSATNICSQYYNKALRLWKSKDFDMAMFYLGAATHLIQDMCVPHHAKCSFTDGHSTYESWAMNHRAEYASYQGGLYMGFTTAEQWIRSNAKFSANYFSLVQANNTEADYHEATSVLLTRAQQSTGGFWLSFYETIMG